MSKQKHCDVIDLVKKEGDSKPKKRKITSTAVNNCDDEVEVVAAPAVVTTVNEGRESTQQDDVQVVGTSNALRLPHMRCHCTVYKYIVDLTEAPSDNLDCCDLCYCYVCDTLVKDCSNWDVHCQATDKSDYWRSERKNIRPSLLTASVNDGRFLKWVVDGMRGLLPGSAKLVCDQDGISMEAIPQSSVWLTKVHLSPSFFYHYQCKHMFESHIQDFEQLYKGVGNAKKKYGTLALNASAENLRLSYEEDDAPQPFNVKLVKFTDRYDLLVPDTIYQSCRMKSIEFKKIVDTLHSFGGNGSLFITCAKDSITFSLKRRMPPAPGTLNRASFLYYKNSKDVLIICDDEPVMIICSLHFLSQCVKVPASLAPFVEICMAKDAPLLLNYGLKGDGDSFIKHYLSPLIYGEDEL